MSQKQRKADPNKTKTGKTRLGPLNYRQLVNMLEKTNRPKDKAKIRNAMAIRLKHNPGLATAVAVETPAESIPAE